MSGGAGAEPALPSGIALVLLAAGQGRRFGAAKQTARLAGIPLWRHAARAASEAGFVTRVIVTRPDAPLAADGWAVAVNAGAEAGLASSIAVGVRAAQAAMRIVLALADMPFVSPAHLRTLALREGTIFTAMPGGGRGIPAAFPAAAFARLLTLAGDRGAASLDWPESTMLAADPATLIDIDTPADLAAAARPKIQP